MGSILTKSEEAPYRRRRECAIVPEGDWRGGASRFPSAALGECPVFREPLKGSGRSENDTGGSATAKLWVAAPFPGGVSLTNGLYDYNYLNSTKKDKLCHNHLILRGYHDRFRLKFPHRYLI